MEKIECTFCGGRKRVTDPKNIFKSVACPVCDGTGVIDGSKAKSVSSTINKIVESDIGGAKNED